MQIVEELLGAMNAAVTDIVDGSARVAVAYSGGLDSAIVASIASSMTEVRCYTACTLESMDRSTAQAFANDQGLKLEMVLLSAGDVRRLAQKAAAVSCSASPVAISYTVPLLAAIDTAEEEVILSGTIADELFAGYAKYASDPSPGKSMAVDLEKALSEYTSIRIYAKNIHKEFASPYADDRVARLADSISIEEKIGPAGRKLILRRLAQEIGLKAHDRPKKAAQYSSGVIKEMRKLAKDDGKTLERWTSDLTS